MTRTFNSLDNLCFGTGTGVSRQEERETNIRERVHLLVSAGCVWLVHLQKQN